MIRWCASRKLEIVMQIKSGTLSYEQADAEYGISPEELRTWIALFDKNPADYRSLCMTRHLEGRRKVMIESRNKLEQEQV